MSLKPNKTPERNAYTYQKTGPDVIGGLLLRNGDELYLTDEDAAALGEAVKKAKSQPAPVVKPGATTKTAKA